MSNPWPLRIVLALIIIGCFAGVVASRTERAPITVRIAFLASRDDEDYFGAMAFKQTVEALLPGRVDVQIFPSGQFCGSERECIEGLQSGVLEMHQTTVGGLATLYPEVQVLDLPYTFPDDAVAECVLDGPVIAEMGDAILRDGLGLRLVAVGNTGGWRSFATTTRQVRSVGDLAGLRIRTLPSALEQEMVRELGAAPMALPWSEVYGALSAKLLDGIKNSVQDVVGMKLDDHIRYLFIDRHAYMASIWWYSEVQWRRLPPDVQAAFREGFRALASETRAAAKRREAPALEEFGRRGGIVVTATAEERAGLKEATRELRDWYVERYGRDWPDRVDAAVAACEAQLRPHAAAME
ncbi:MAG: extracellular solute-binding protein [Proteobacteria bacterium]|nr:extracellular solute-binding protein [Pseudomonadota bacterium]